MMKQEPKTCGLDSVFCIDPHVDIFSFYCTDRLLPDDRRLRTHLSARDSGGHHAAVLVAYVGQTARTRENYDAAWKMACTKINAIDRLVTQLAPERVEKGTTASELLAIHQRKKLGVAIGIENGFSIAKDLSRLTFAKQRGVIYFGLTHNGHNDLADSAIPLPNLNDVQEEHGGLSEFGRQAVAECNRLGILVDVAHASRHATLQTCELSKSPVIASHTGCRALADTPRNVDDDCLQAIAATGGVVCITALPLCLGRDPDETASAKEERAKLVERLTKENPHITSEEITFARFCEMSNDGTPTALTSSSVAQLADHLDYAVKKVGIDHVGISSDFDGGGGIVGWQNAAETPNVTQELVRRGYSAEQVNKLWSGNFLRALAQAQDRGLSRPEF
jgi:membrane dipeptidase